MSYQSLPRLVLATALAVTGFAMPASAQGSGDIFGTWYRSAGPGGTRLTQDGTAQVLGSREWANNASTCTDHFAHEIRTIDRADLEAELTQDPVSNNDGVPIASALQGRLPEGQLAVVHNVCYGAAEIGGSVYYILVAPTRLLAVAFGDGIFDITDMQRDPPLVPPQSLDQATREQIQRALQAGGYYEGDIDGLFGGGTRSAISDYQTARGDEGTGILNRSQLDRLLED